MNNEGTQAPPSGYKQFIADHKEEIREIWKKVTTLRDKNNYIIFFAECRGKRTRRTAEDHLRGSSCR